MAQFVQVPTEAAIQAARDSWHKIAEAATRASDAGALQLAADLSSLCRQQETLVKALEDQRDRYERRQALIPPAGGQ